MEEVPVDVARWAVGPGRATIADVTASLADGMAELAVGTELRARGLGVDRAAFATGAAATRLRARSRGLPYADDLVLTREALEQASRPAAAAWRARRAAAALAAATDPRLQDRCAGTGGDSAALARHAPVLAIERDPGRAVLAADRAAVLGLPVEVRVADALEPSLPTRGAVVHADPDRRDQQGRRAHRLAHHRPAVDALLAATDGATGRLVTVTPGVAWDDPELPATAEVVFLQEGPDLLEAVICTEDARAGGARATAVLLDHDLARSRGGERGPVAPVGEVGTALLRPAPALVRARLHDELAEELGASRVARCRALLTSGTVPPPSPWYEVELVEAVLTARPRALRDHLRSRPGRRVELVLHGLTVDVPGWLRAAGAPETGPHDLRVHLVRRDEDAVAILTTARPRRDGGRG